MNSAPLFLAGAAGLAVVGSLLVWLVSRPRKQTSDPHEFRSTLRAMSRGHHGYRPTSGPESSGMRVLPPESPDPTDEGRPGGTDGG